MTPSPEQVSQLLVAWGEGNEVARDELMPLASEVLKASPGTVMKHRTLAKAWLRKTNGQQYLIRLEL